MKKLLLLILLLPVITQAQSNDALLKYTEIVNDHFKFILKEIDQRTLVIEALSDIASKQGAKIKILENRIAVLENIVNRLYQKAQQDSLYYQKMLQVDYVHEPLPDTIWIDSEMDIYDLPIVRLRKWRK